MKKYQYLVCMIVVAMIGCKKSKNNSTDPSTASNFDATRGWKLVATVTDDDNVNGTTIGRLGFCGLDFNGTNNNLRVFYWQGWQSQQGFLYSNTRLDEFSSSGQRVARKELEYINNFQNNTPNYYRQYMLRNGIPIILTLDQSGGASGYKWQVFSNDTLLAATKPQWGEGIGNPLWIDNNAINIGDHYGDPSNNRTAFSFKHYNNSMWEYFNEGFTDNGYSYMIGGQVINGTAYAFLAAPAGTDSTAIAVYTYNTAAGTWAKLMQQNVAWPQFDFSSYDGKIYLGNGTTPVLVFTSASRMTAYQADVVAKTITIRSDIATPPHAQSWAVLNGDIYMAYNVQVSKLAASGLQPVGLSGITKTGNEIRLAVANNKLYCITYKMGVNHEEMYIATPQ